MTSFVGSWILVPKTDITTTIMNLEIESHTNVNDADVHSITMIMTDSIHSVDSTTDYGCGWDDFTPIQPGEEEEDGFTSLSSISQEDVKMRDDSTNNTTKECCICYEMIDSTKNNCITPCGHSFCFICIVKSIQVRNTCPCCRQPFYIESSSPGPLPRVRRPTTTIPMMVDGEDGDVTEHDWFMEESTTYTQDDGGHNYEGEGNMNVIPHNEYSEYDEWPPATAVHEMLMLQHTLDSYDRIEGEDTTYEVMNRNLTSLNIPQVNRRNVSRDSLQTSYFESSLNVSMDDDDDNMVVVSEADPEPEPMVANNTNETNDTFTTVFPELLDHESVVVTPPQMVRGLKRPDSSLKRYIYGHTIM